MRRYYLAIFVGTLLASTGTLVALDRFLWESDTTIPVVALALAITVMVAIYSARRHAGSGPSNRDG